MPRLDWVPENDIGAAQGRAAQFLNVDPFPDIPRALLSKEHIVQYAKQAAMIYPAYGIDKSTGLGKDDALKPASYETRPGSFVIHYDKQGKLRRENFNLNKHGVIRIPANSITFVSTRDRFFLPNYVAMRFNLRIKHVHRGLLLGTGPLVDPGYDKEILIPLHNLTDSDYHISLDEGLIWVEFTKTSAARQDEPFVDRDIKLAGEAKERNLAGHTRKSIEEYLFKANSGYPIRSSIPKAIIEAENSAASAARRVRVIQTVGILALVSLAVGLVSVFLSVMSLISDTNSYLRDLDNRVTAIENTR